MFVKKVLYTPNKLTVNTRPSLLIPKLSYNDININFSLLFTGIRLPEKALHQYKLHGHLNAVNQRTELSCYDKQTILNNYRETKLQ